MHLNDSQLESAGTTCHFCDAADRRAVYTLQKDPEIFLLECAHCHAVSASRMPKEDVLVEYYEDYFFTPEFLAESHQKVTIDDYPRFARHILSGFRAQISKKQVKLLDFGGGDGAISMCLAVLLRQMGVEKVEILVVDFNDEVVPPSDPDISIGRKATLEGIPPSSCDIVIASAVIEHLPHPQSTLEGLFSVLKLGGLFYARTPYMVPIARLAGSFGVHMDITYPAHVHDLGQDFWEWYVLGKGFSIIASRPSIVESTFKEHFSRAIAAYGLKAPWYLFGRRYRLVGGWEIFAKKKGE